MSFLFGAVLECPSLAYAEGLIQNEQLRTVQTAQEGGEPVVLVVHMTPEHVVQDPMYQEWLKGYVACASGEPAAHASKIFSVAFR